MSLDAEAIIDEVETPETSVTLCVKGSLVAEYERLEAQLDTAPVATNLAGTGGGAATAGRMAELREQMRAHQRTLTLRAVTPRGAWRKLDGKRPVKTPEMDADAWADQYHAWLCEVVAASALDPPMTPGQVERLADKLSDGQWTKLANAAWSINNDVQGIPFSVAASVLSRSSGERSRQPEPLESPDRGSLAGNPDPSPNTSTTTPVD